MSKKTYGRESYEKKEYRIEDIAYLAGIIDGEGCLTAGTYSKTTAGNPSFQTMLKVSNTEEKLINWLKDTFGGLICNYTPAQTAKNSRKQVFMWQVSGDRLLHICELTLPFSVSKKEQLQTMIKLRETFKDRGYTKGRNGPSLDISVIEERHRLCDHLKFLHSR